MKFNKERLKRLASLGDEELWSELVNLAGEYGIKLSGKKPTSAELSRVRRIFSGEEKIGMIEAMKIINEYKSGGR